MIIYMIIVYDPAHPEYDISYWPFLDLEKAKKFLDTQVVKVPGYVYEIIEEETLDDFAEEL